MNELLKRGVTGVIYIFLLLVAIMLNASAFDFLFLIFGLICIYEFKRIVRLSDYRIFIVFLFLWWICIQIQVHLFVKYLLLFAVIITNIILILHLFRKEKIIYNEREKFLLNLLYVGGGCIFIPLIYQGEIQKMLDYEGFPLQEFFFTFPTEVKGLNEAQHTMIAILCIIWASDSFAYIAGKNFGKNKLFPSVSPKKTYEGFAGGLIGALATGIAFSLYSEKSVFAWIVLTLVIVIMGVLGDLIESKFKRAGGKKDSGTILPGHGGLLDRLDSLLFASPFAYLTLELIEKFHF